MDAEFPDGVAVVLGGSGGVGRAVVERLAQAGCDVALTFRTNPAAADEAAAHARAAGVKASAHALALGDAAAVRDFFAAVAAEHGRIHSVIHAAGSAIPQPFISQIEPAQWRAVIEADVNGVFDVVHASLPHLRVRGGSYVFISSAGLERFPPGDILSVAPKAAVEALLRGLAREEGRHGIRANTVALGVIETGMFPRLVADGHLSPEWLAAARKNAALRRFGSAREVADAVVFLASNRASYITGQRLMLDGGYAL